MSVMGNSEGRKQKVTLELLGTKLQTEEKKRLGTGWRVGEVKREEFDQTRQPVVDGRGRRALKGLEITRLG